MQPEDCLYWLSTHPQTHGGDHGRLRTPQGSMLRATAKSCNTFLTWADAKVLALAVLPVLQDRGWSRAHWDRTGRSSCARLLSTSVGGSLRRWWPRTGSAPAWSAR